LQSGAKINISDGSCPERIVTVTGTTDSIFKAFTLICNKFEEVSGNFFSFLLGDFSPLMEDVPPLCSSPRSRDPCGSSTSRAVQSTAEAAAVFESDVGLTYFGLKIYIYIIT
jgi:hypothetical protein